MKWFTNFVHFSIEDLRDIKISLIFFSLQDIFHAILDSNAQKK